jgi:hypothetical protein
VRRRSCSKKYPRTYDKEEEEDKEEEVASPMRQVGGTTDREDFPTRLTSAGVALE